MISLSSGDRLACSRYSDCTGTAPPPPSSPLLNPGSGRRRRGTGGGSSPLLCGSEHGNSLLLPDSSIFLRARPGRPVGWFHIRRGLVLEAIASSSAARAVRLVRVEMPFPLLLRSRGALIRPAPAVFASPPLGMPVPVAATGLPRKIRCLDWTQFLVNSPALSPFLL